MESSKLQETQIHKQEFLLINTQNSTMSTYQICSKKKIFL